MEERLWQFIEYAEENGNIINDCTLTRKAIELCSELFEDTTDLKKRKKLLSFKATRFWLKGFKERHGIPRLIRKKKKKDFLQLLQPKTLRDHYQEFDRRMQ